MWAWSLAGRPHRGRIRSLLGMWVARGDGVGDLLHRRGDVGRRRISPRECAQARYGGKGTSAKHRARHGRRRRRFRQGWTKQWRVGQFRGASRHAANVPDVTGAYWMLPDPSCIIMYVHRVLIHAPCDIHSTAISIMDILQGSARSKLIPNQLPPLSLLLLLLWPPT
jgi:hypothetical protein